MQWVSAEYGQQDSKLIWKMTIDYCVILLLLSLCNCYMYFQANIFSEYNMEGVSVTDANEIYLETVPENFVRCLRSAQNAKSVKIKLTKKQTPCLTFEVELVSNYLSVHLIIARYFINVTFMLK